MDSTSNFTIGDKVQFTHYIDSANGEWKRVSCIIPKKGIVSAVLYAQTPQSISAVNAPYKVLAIDIHNNGSYQVLPSDAAKIFV